MPLVLYLFTGLLSWSAICANLTLDKKALEDESQKTLFFDAHNHDSGVIPPLGMVDAEKFIYGQPVTLSELKKFWSTIVNSDVFKENILSDVSISNGFKMFMTCNEPMRYCSQLIDNKMCEKKLIDGISHLLSATPLTGFNTAYAIRRSLSDIEDLPSRSDKLTRAHALLFELAKTKVDLVEMSKTAFGEEVNTANITYFKNLLDDLRKESPLPENKKFKDRLVELGMQVPRIKWLLMLHTLEMGTVNDNETATYSDGQCSLVPLGENLKTDPKSSLYSVLLNFDDVVGVDVAGAEVTCFTKQGMEKFKNLAETTYLASIAKKREKASSGKLVVRAHVGEGFPIYDVPLLRSQLGACNAIKNFPQTNKLFNREQDVASHRPEAQKNIAYMLDAIRELKEKYPDILDHVIFRLAHVTHINDALAKWAKNLGVTVDINLSSNVATGAWPVDSAIIQKHLMAKGISPENSPALLDTLVKQGASLGEIFDNHGLKWILLNQVPVTLGSDGSGVEHSESLRKEYLMTKELIDYWNAKDTKFADKKISIDDVLQYQKTHFDQMGY